MVFKSDWIEFGQIAKALYSSNTGAHIAPGACGADFQPFLDPVWIAAWGAQFLSPRQQVLCLPCSGNFAAAFVPLFVGEWPVRSIRYRALQVVGASNAGWLDVSSGDADAQNDVYGPFSRLLFETAALWDIALLQRVRGKQKAEALVDGANRVGLVGRCYPCGCLIGTNSYSGGTAYLASRQKSFLSGVRRHYRRMQEEGDVCIHLFGAGSSRSAIEALEWIDSIVSNSWQGRSRSSVFSRGNPDVREFHLKLLDSSQYHVCAPTIAVLTLNGVPIAYQYGFQSATHYTNYAREYDERFGARSPGGVLNLLYMASIFDAGVQVVDFGVGDAHDKRKWGDWNETLYSVYLFHNGWRSRMFRQFQDLRRASKRIYYSIARKDPF